MYCISISDCEQAINNATMVSNETIKIWKNCLKKIKKDFIFNSKEELEQLLINIDKSYSTIYNICGLLRATCKINNVDIKIKDIVYPLYKELRNKSEIEQLDNRMKMKHWLLEDLIEIMRNIQMTDYKSMMNKLYIAMYTINPPLRNDYFNVKIITDNSPVNDTENYIKLNNKILNIYCLKSKKFKQTLLSDELINIINDSLIILPRNYLFTKKNGQPYTMKESLYNYMIKNMKKLFNDKDFSINTFRHAYAEWSLKQNVKTRLQAAEQMMHNKFNHITY